MPAYHFEKLNRYGLLRAIARDGRSLRKITKAAGISYNCGLKLTDMRSKQEFIRPDTVDRLCRVLDVDREELVL